MLENKTLEGKTMSRAPSVVIRVAAAAIILCFGVSRLQAQTPAPASPAPDARDSRMSAPAVSSAAQTAKSNAPKQAPLLLELTKEAPKKSARPGAEAHFRVVEDVIKHINSDRLCRAGSYYCWHPR